MSAREIVIFQPFEQRPSALRETLQSGGFSSRVVNSTDELEQAIESNPDDFAFIDVGDRELEALELVKTAIGSRTLRQTALIVLGKEADAFETALDKYFSLSITLNAPCSASEILKAVQYLERRAGPIASASYVISTPEPATTHTSYEPRDGLEESIPEILFDRMQQLPDAPETTVPSKLKRAITYEALESLGMLSPSDKIRTATKAVYSELPAWSRDHICRMTFLAHRFLQVLRVPTAQAADTRDAGLLLPCAFVTQSNNILRKNYLIGNQGVRHEIASKLKDSAMKVMSEYGSSAPGKIIASMARLLAQEEAPDDNNPDHIAAGCLLAGDLVNRLCFQAGHWNPRGAHSLMKSLKDRKVNLIPTPVLACTVQFLSEALIQLPKTFLLPKTVRNSPELLELARKFEEYEPTEDEMRVPLDSLEPGMKLSKPIFAYDGREILAQEVILDQDLIWRLWQLSSIRPVNTPLVALDK
ncbi:MAG: hypothetical protein KDD64_02520 [Bdellovibrionales bacterium]|nr:hypothetical protein [Bdellovibrionales bacterium]